MHIRQFITDQMCSGISGGIERFTIKPGINEDVFDGGCAYRSARDAKITNMRCCATIIL
jgi:hypothetical protein